MVADVRTTGREYAESHNFFSVSFQGISEAIQAPMNHGHIYRQEDGRDIKRKELTYLHPVKDFDLIEKLTIEAVEKKVKESNDYHDHRIAKLKAEIAQIENKKLIDEAVCREHHAIILSECKT